MTPLRAEGASRHTGRPSRTAIGRPCSVTRSPNPQSGDRRSVLRTPGEDVGGRHRMARVRILFHAGGSYVGVPTLSSERPIRLGIIGTGLAVKRLHWPVLRQMPDRFAIAGFANRTRATAEEFAAVAGLSMEGRWWQRCAPGGREHAGRPAGVRIGGGGRSAGGFGLGGVAANRGSPAVATGRIRRPLRRSAVSGSSNRSLATRLEADQAEYHRQEGFVYLKA